MSWQDSTNEEDGYEWICSFLSSHGGNLLEFELDEDGQQFFNNMNAVLDRLSSSKSYPDDISRPPLQQTPFIMSTVSEPHNTLLDSQSQPGAPPSRTSATTPKEVQPQMDMVELRSRSFRRAATTPRNRSKRRRLPVSAAPEDTTSIPSSTKANARSGYRQKINRRLF
ncbi:unnamed protein product [Phytophthora fragariaefolia]|uniref:Unnamed protein product n=1 Tax=Phytophthora fragariaefolia TaxID=1490495 RepID=A0A9W6YFQ6_9STRA|nr:unnamed protein product [Phytophthora fragariaefolia]